MRVRNKELRNRRHRKQQRVKELIKQAIAEAKVGKKAPKAKAAPAVKKAAAPKAEAAPKKTTKKKTEEVAPETPSES